RQQASHDHRGRRLHRLGHAIGRAGARGQGCDAGGGHHSDARRAGRAAYGLAQPADHRGRLAAPPEKIVSAERPVSASPGRPALPDGLPAPRRYWAATTVLTGISMSVLDTTIANVALPTIATDLNAQPSQAVWIVNAYNLAVVVLLLPLSALAERIGFRRMFTIGLGLFATASLCGALSTALWQLTLARVVQGVGAASLMCMFGGLVRNIYPLR